MAKRIHFIALFIFGATILCNAIPVLEQEYKIQAIKRDGNSRILILRLQENGGLRQGRQEEEEENSTPFIPAVIPALTKIFTGIITGNLNDIFHGSTSFAPQNVSYEIDNVYNQIVGLPKPVSTQPTTRKPSFQLITDEPPNEPAEVASTVKPAATTSTSAAANATKIVAGQPLQGQSVVIASSATSTIKSAQNEDDEDENDADRFEAFEFRRL